ncbi:DnaB-like helicase N-terminal domain-containing protein, partial [Streptococcus pneumoniae]|uniref:DnaB-like helicase N-terminal domain-containing protein n=1 Tax=Streptococcus pneumoniae TaxID=1313 RepID=UPI000AA5A801
MAEVEELRVQPQDILAEQSVLGAIFIDESKLVFVREYIESRDFFKYAHRLIFQAMVDLSDRGDAIDATTGFISISARSRSKLNVQRIMEELGG